MRLLHRPDRDSTANPESRTLARDVDVARSRFAQARGLMFRRSIPDDYALVFPFESAETRWLHMLFVPFAIDAVWLVDGEVTSVTRLAPFVGLARGEADTVVELPAGAADGVAVGDAVVCRE
ncbi:DUF192 domain-containing protein [Halorubrum halodurans]|uniref:DUF192 domain-containing protein n=1 Tax=Halorubrum halodurans TaxID=1383851 RepID=A0A256IGK2_9EURY|nr:DUF192 domain-containing protein [Halorubrum halodurans]OYR55688.1 hypothetical protein DJ70_11310 [Halorubrum halodurans]